MLCFRMLGFADSHEMLVKGDTSAFVFQKRPFSEHLDNPPLPRLCTLVQLFQNHVPKSSVRFLPFATGTGTLRAMLIGYARVSTQDQNLDLQNDALHKAGCEQFYKDTLSGAKASRPGLDDCLAYARHGDTIVVWKLDRLGRSLKNLIEVTQALEARGVGLKSLQENIDTTTPGGKLVFHVFGALAEFERDLIRERTNAGLQAARARGRQGGRRALLDEKTRRVALSLHADPTVSIGDICRTLKVSRTTLYRTLQSEKKSGQG